LKKTACLADRKIFIPIFDPLSRISKGDSNLQNEQGAEAISRSGKNVEFLQ